MKHCASCKTEFTLDDLTFCPECGGKLLGEDEWAEHMRRLDLENTRLRGIKMVPACPVSGWIEASPIVSILEQESIPVFVRRYDEIAYDGLFVAQHGWGEIWVAEDRRDAALGIIEEMRKNPPPPPPDSE